MEGSTGTGRDANLSNRPFKEMEQEGLIQKEQKDFVKQQSCKEEEDSDSKEEEESEETSSSMDSGEREKLTSTSRKRSSSSHGQLSLQENLLSSTR